MASLKCLIYYAVWIMVGWGNQLLTNFSHIIYLGRREKSLFMNLSCHILFGMKPWTTPQNFMISFSSPLSIAQGTRKFLCKLDNLPSMVTDWSLISWNNMESQLNTYDCDFVFKHFLDKGENSRLKHLKFWFFYLNETCHFESKLDPSCNAKFVKWAMSLHT